MEIINSSDLKKEELKLLKKARFGAERTVSIPPNLRHFFQEFLVAFRKQNRRHLENRMDSSIVVVPNKAVNLIYEYIYDFARTYFIKNS